MMLEMKRFGALACPSNQTTIVIAVAITLSVLGDHWARLLSIAMSQNKKFVSGQVSSAGPTQHVFRP